MQVNCEKIPTKSMKINCYLIVNLWMNPTEKRQCMLWLWGQIDLLSLQLNFKKCDII